MKRLLCAVACAICFCSVPAFGVLVVAGSHPDGTMSWSGAVTNTASNSILDFSGWSTLRYNNVSIALYTHPNVSTRLLGELEFMAYRNQTATDILEETIVVPPYSPLPPNFNFSRTITFSNETFENTLLGKSSVRITFGGATVLDLFPVSVIDAVDFTGTAFRSINVGFEVSTVASTDFFSAVTEFPKVPEPRFALVALGISLAFLRRARFRRSGQS
jgi:hypothetical protein